MLYLNGQPLSVTLFPDHTSQVWKLPEETFKSNKAHVRWEFESESEIIHLLQLQHLLTTANRNVETTVYIKYLPYGRQDKSVSNDATFALQTFWKILAPFNFHKLIIMDPHSFDSIRPNCAVVTEYPRKQVEQVAQEMDKNGASTIFCFPDKGALSKYSLIYKDSYRPYIHGEKVRDQATGKILSYQVVGDCAGKNVLIVDDICDGGATFVLLARDLLAAGAKSVVLFVTHGIFSKGLKPLREAGIQAIYTQDGEAGEIQGHICYRRL